MPAPETFAAVEIARLEELERQIEETNRQVAEWESDQKRLAQQLEELRQKHHTTLQEQHELETQIASFAGPEGEKSLVAFIPLHPTPPSGSQNNGSNDHERT